MKISVLSAAAIALLVLTGYSGTARADAAAGKAIYQADCSECHEAADFAGEDPKEAATTIKQIVAGTHKHKKALKLTDSQIADVAAFLTAAR